jgi:hypothetical protein
MHHAPCTMHHTGWLDDLKRKYYDNSNCERLFYYFIIIFCLFVSLLANRKFISLVSPSWQIVQQLLSLSLSMQDDCKTHGEERTKKAFLCATGSIRSRVKWSFSQ